MSGPCEYVLVWSRSDSQGSSTHSIEMGDFPSRAAAESSIPSATDELLSECRSETERENILAGSWEVRP